MTGTPTGLVEVRLLQLPVQIWAATQEHTDGLLREFALLTADTGQNSPDHQETPARLLELVDEVTAQYAGVGDEQRARLFAAAGRGETAMDLTYLLPPAAAQACDDLDRMLDEADDYCRAGQHLLTLATPSNQVAFRKWYLGEIAAQLAGATATPWPHYARARGVTTPS